MFDDTLTRENFNLVSGPDYAAKGYPHSIWTQLRKDDPIHWYEQADGGPSFWAVTKSEDIQTVGRLPDLFQNGPRLVLDNTQANDSDFPATLIQMDPPKHTDYRKLASKRFTPGRLRKLHGDIELLAKEIIDSMLAEGNEGECDFVEKVSAPLPIAVIAWLLGVPREDWRLLFDWTNRTIGANDPDFIGDGMTGRETALQAMTELFTYFSGLVEDRRKNPQDDLITFFAEMEVDGKRIPDVDVLTWNLIIVIAGNETTRNATSGGMLALIEHQEQLRKIQGDVDLLKNGVEEILRWTSPIIHFCRTASEDTELGGRKIEKGQHLGLFYPSANRDEDVFENPFEFQIDRYPNRHLAFGVGEHFCLGAHVARLEMEFAYRYLLPRIEEIELAGPVVRLQSALVGGLKSLPIRYKLNEG
ncbi:MAG: cytochrome P450 [Candidatus Binatia bacterium]|nr:cytochrome P450 [Candidatus Binatia bacterium]